MRTTDCTETEQIVELQKGKPRETERHGCATLGKIPNGAFGSLQLFTYLYLGSQIRQYAQRRLKWTLIAGHAGRSNIQI